MEKQRKRCLTAVLLLLCVFAFGCTHEDGTRPATTTALPQTTAPTTTTPVTTATPTTVPVTQIPTIPGLEHDTQYGRYLGKIFVHQDYADRFFGYTIKLNSDGTFVSEGSLYLFFIPDTGTWTLEGDLLTLYLDEDLRTENEGWCTTFRYCDGVLTFIKGEHDLRSMYQVEDGTQYLFLGVIE